jgi:sRNA-binding regulator protein Hfq
MDKDKISNQSEFIEWAVEEKRQVAVFLKNNEIIRGTALDFDEDILIVKSDEEVKYEIRADDIHTFYTTSNKKRLSRRIEE